MKISLNWLKEYINLESENPNDIALKFTMASAEIEEIQNLAKNFDNVVTAKILEIKQHPHADKLKVTKIFTGDEELQVVCGANNIKEGQIVPLARVGAVLSGEFKIKVSNKRGIESFGMLCSAAELGIGEDSEGILILPENTPVGMPFSKYLGKDDFIIVIDNKSITHRPDLWGHYGIARELSAILKKELKTINFNLPETENTLENFNVSIEDKVLCPRYSALVIDNVEINESPKWLQERLINIGSRPINNVVDATNYVMFELGQPLHAFDYNKVDSEIIIRRAYDNEKVTLLDNSEKILTSEMLVIADKSKAIALAGIMGCSNSEVSNNTKTIILESANFNAGNIRRTSIRLGIRTEASTRFEKSLDNNLTIQAISRFYSILKQTSPNIKCISKLYDLNYSNNKSITINITLDFVNKKLGTIINKDFFEETLKNLGFKIKENSNNYKIEVPSYRATKDIQIPEDIVEEIGRIYGYDNIEPKAPLVEIKPIQEKEIHLLRKNIRNSLSVGLGMKEVYNYSFNSKEQIEKLNLDLNKHIKVKNPLSSQQEYLRYHLVPNMLLSVEKNYRNFDNFSIYEIGKVFVKEENSFREEEFLCAFIYSKKINNPIFYKAKEYLIYLLENINVSDFEIEYPKDDIESFYHPGRTGIIKQRKLLIGKVSEIHPKTIKLFDISGYIGLFYLDLNSIIQSNKKRIKFKELPKYPYVPFDISIIVDNKTTVKEVKDIIYKVDKHRIQNVEIFDIYEGSNLPEGKKSFAFNIKFYSKEKTLESNEIKELENSIINTLNKFYQVRC